VEFLPQKFIVNCRNHIVMNLLGVTQSPGGASLDVSCTLGCTLLSEEGNRRESWFVTFIFTAEAMLYHSVPAVSRELEAKKGDRKISSLILPPSPEIIQTFVPAHCSGVGLHDL